VLREHCAAEQRPFEPVLHTFHVLSGILGRKRGRAGGQARMPPAMLAMAGPTAVIGTPKQALDRLRPLIAAGCQYSTLAIMESDTLRVLAGSVVTAISWIERAGSTRAGSRISHRTRSR
jgi:hypothetical protein